MKLKTISLFSVLLLTTTFCFAQNRGVYVRVKNAQGQAKDVKLYDGSYALVIGESDYTNGWDNLPLVKTDVAEVRRVLENANFKVEAEMNLTSDALKSRIDRFISDYGFGQNNRLLIYFAGHGHTQKTLDGRDLGYIVSVDAPLPDKDEIGFKRKAIPMDTIQDFARRIEAKHAIFIFDSCFSGKLVSRGEFKVPPVILEDVTYPVRQFITAGAANQTVPDDSVFRKAFVRGLEGEADRNDDKFITGTELAEFLKEKVTNATDRAQTPQYGKIRDIDLERGDFVFTIAPKTSPIVVVLPNNSLRAESIANQALGEIMRGNYKEANRLANEALQLQDNSALAFGVRGWAQSTFDNDYKASRTDLEKAVQLDSSNGLFRARLAATYQILKENDLAKRTANEVLKLLKTPSTAIDYYARGLSYYVLENPDNAISDYTKAIELNPQFALAYNNRAIIYNNKQNYDAAIRDYTKAIELNPQYAMVYYSRGIIYYSNKEDNNAAIRDFTKTIELNPQYYYAYVYRGIIYNYHKQDYDAAIRDYTKAIELNQTYALAYINRGVAYYNKKDYDTSIRDYTKAIELNPKYAEAYFYRGASYYNKQDNDAAIRDYTKSIELNSKYAEAYTNRGAAYQNKQDNDAAIRDFTKSIELNPAETLAYYNRGISYHNKQNYDAAIRDFTKAIELNPQDALAYENRSIAYDKIGRKDLAESDRRKAEGFKKKPANDNSGANAIAIGEWDLTTNANGQETTMILNIKQSPANLIGEMSSVLGNGIVEKGELIGNTFKAILKINVQGQLMDFQMEGKIVGNKMTGTLTNVAFPPINFTAIRKN